MWFRSRVRRACPSPGWLEQSVELMWGRICDALREAVAGSGVGAPAIKSLGISSQRGTSIWVGGATSRSPEIDRLILRPARSAFRNIDLIARRQHAYV